MFGHCRSPNHCVVLLINCAQNVKIKYEKCLPLPQCSGVWLMNFDKDKCDKDKIDKDLSNKIENLTKQYWKFKDSYDFPKYLSNGIKNPKHYKGEGRFPSK